MRPWIELLADRRQCHEVRPLSGGNQSVAATVGNGRFGSRKAMEVLLKETKEECPGKTMDSDSWSHDLAEGILF